MPINLTTLISWTFFAKHKPWSLTKDELKTQIVSYLSKIFNALSNGKYQVQVALWSLWNICNGLMGENMIVLLKMLAHPLKLILIWEMYQ